MRLLAETLLSWGLPGLFLIALLDSAGIPLPATVDALLVTLAVTNPGHAYIAAGLATTGSAAGCMILFYLGRKGGEHYLDKHTQTGRTKRFREWFRHYGLVTVFVPALLPVPLPVKVFVISAGVFGIRAASFLLVVLAARLPRYFGLAYLGAQLGEQPLEWLQERAWVLTGFTVGLALFLILLVRLAGRFRKRTGRLG